MRGAMFVRCPLVLNGASRRSESQRAHPTCKRRVPHRGMHLRLFNAFTILTETVIGVLQHLNIGVAEVGEETEAEAGC